MKTVLSYYKVTEIQELILANIQTQNEPATFREKLKYIYKAAHFLFLKEIQN